MLFQWWVIFLSVFQAYGHPVLCIRKWQPPKANMAPMSAYCIVYTLSTSIRVVSLFPWAISRSLSFVCFSFLSLDFLLFLSCPKQTKVHWCSRQIFRLMIFPQLPKLPHQGREHIIVCPSCRSMHNNGTEQTMLGWSGFAHIFRV